MNRPLLLLLAGAAMGFGTACEPRNEAMSPDHATAIVDSVRATLSDFARHASAGHWDSLIALYETDPGFRWVEEGRVVARSAEQIGAKLRSMPAGTRLDNEFKDTDVMAIAPGVASVVTNFHTTMRDTTGPKFSFGGSLTMTMVHREGGWRFLVGHRSGLPSSAPQ